MAKRLTYHEIEELASRPGVKRIAVENFLSTLPLELPRAAQYGNLEMDARSYRWNQATQEAIAAGIERAYKK